MTNQPHETQDIRAALLAGLGFTVAMGAGAFLIPGDPTPFLESGRSTQAVMEWVRAHHGALVTTRYLEGIAGDASVVFLGGFLRRVRGEDDRLNPFAFTAALGGVLTIAVSFAKLAAGVTFVRLAEAGVSVDALQVTHELSLTLMDFLALAQALFWGAASLALLRSAVGPRWLAILGLVGSMARLVSTAQIFEPRHPLGAAGALVFPLFATWMISAPIVLSRVRSSRGVPLAAAHD